jgi:hypothetical protein
MGYGGGSRRSGGGSYGLGYSSFGNRRTSWDRHRDRGRTVINNTYVNIDRDAGTYESPTVYDDAAMGGLGAVDYGMQGFGMGGFGFEEVKRRKESYKTAFLLLLATALLLIGSHLAGKSYEPIQKIEAEFGRGEKVLYNDGFSKTWGSEMWRVSRASELFYDETGITPYVVVSSEYAYWESEEFERRTNEMFNEYELSESSLLVHVSDNQYGDWQLGWVVGKQAEIIMDDKAQNILGNNLEDEWYTDKTEGELLYEALTDTSGQVSGTNVYYFSILLLVLGIVAFIAMIIVTIYTVKTNKSIAEANRNREAARILNTPIDEKGSTNYVSDEVSDLADK